MRKFFSSISSTEFVLKIADKVLFLRKKHMRTKPSHSRKLIGGGGFLGSMRMTLHPTSVGHQPQERRMNEWIQ